MSSMVKRPKRDPHALTYRDIKVFMHNAQLAAVERVSDDRIPACYYYKEELLQHLLSHSSFTHHELAAVLVSVAYDLVTMGRQNGAEKIQAIR